MHEHRGTWLSTMYNRFKHTGTLHLPDGPEWPYAFGPNQTAILCESQGWEFWEHEEKMLPALYALTRFAQVSEQADATAEEVEQAALENRRGLFNNPVFVQNFCYAAVKFGHELAGLPVDFTPAEVGMWWQEHPAAFTPLFAHYVQQQVARINMAAARPTPAPRAGEAKKTVPKKMKVA